MSITRVQKGPSEPITNEQLSLLNYPIVGSPKLDGFRCVVDHEPLTSSLKQWPNAYIRDVLSRSKYHGLDGEIVVGAPNDPNVFHNTSGPVRRYNGNPDFTYFVFDNWLNGNLTYEKRWLENLPERDDHIIVLSYKLLSSPKEVIDYEQEMLDIGFEGAMIRSIHSIYKMGRCSLRDMNIFKRKPFVDTEAVIEGFIEGTTNNNIQHVTETGNRRRSSHKENMIPNNTLGSFLLKSPLWNAQFSAGLGLGFTQQDKQEIWDQRKHYLGTTVTIKYQKYGSRDAPRIPSVIKLRPNWDIS